MSAEPRQAVSKAMSSGNARQGLEALRDVLAAEVDRPQCPVCEGRDARQLAALSRELREVLAALDKLPAAPTGKTELQLLISDSA
jgi:hypothetical protein